MLHLWESGRLGVLCAFCVEKAPWGIGRESGLIFRESTGICAFISLPSPLAWLDKFTWIEGDCIPVSCCLAKREVILD